MKKVTDFPQVKSAWILGPLLLLVIIMVLPSVSLASQPVSSPFAISQESEQEVSPSIAYNSQRQEYLVVWYNDRAGCDDIRAQRLRWDGSLIGPSFYINAGCPQNRRYPDVVYNSAADQYLVVWEQQDASNGYSIRARRVSGLGEVLNSSDIVIRDDGSIMYTPLNPAVAYDPAVGMYLVVWEEIWHSTITSTIYGQRLSNSATLDGSRLIISEGSDARQQPDLAYNQHANCYLVVWQQKNGSEWEIRGRFVYGDGSLGTIEKDIADASTISYTAPAVAASPLGSTDYAFFVVFESSDTTSDMVIYGRMVNEYGQHSTSYYGVGDDLSYNSSPAVASMDSTNGSYLVVWRCENPLGDASIRGSLVIGDTWFYPVYEFFGVYTKRPAIARGLNGDFLVAWQDLPLTSENLMGQLWGNRVYLPVIRK
jgi:hypothetical protein